MCDRVHAAIDQRLYDRNRRPPARNGPPSRHSERKCQVKRIVIATAMSPCMVSRASIASADTLILTDGTRVSGLVVSVAARTMTFEDVSGVSRRCNASRVDAEEKRR